MLSCDGFRMEGKGEAIADANPCGLMWV